MTSSHQSLLGDILIFGQNYYGKICLYHRVFAHIPDCHPQVASTGQLINWCKQSLLAGDPHLHWRVGLATLHFHKVEIASPDLEPQANNGFQLWLADKLWLYTQCWYNYGLLQENIGVWESRIASPSWGGGILVHASCCLLYIKLLYIKKV